MTDTAYTQDLLARLEKLERFVRVMKVSLVLCGLLIGAVSALAQNTDGDFKARLADFNARALAIERANLWIKDYRNLRIVTEVKANTLGITENAVQTKVELRLR